jgi:predicted short-subunit dehydrogenase-like oxidoreductase (DUF2520 family)
MIISNQKKNVSVVGAGKVGTTLAVLLFRAGYRIVSVIGQRKESVGKLARIVNCKNYSNSVFNIHPETHILLIAVPDEAIAEVSDSITKNSSIDFKQLIAFHTSGSVTSDAMKSLSNKGANVFSLHPIQSFPKRLSLRNQIDRMTDIFYGFEGQSSVKVIAGKMASDMGGTLIRIPKERKILYHIACVMASNYSVALLGAASDLAKLVGRNLKLKHLAPLVKTSINNALSETPGKALTGPIRRGSSRTVEKHLLELKNNKRFVPLYKIMGMEALRIVKSEILLNSEKVKQLERILAYNELLKKDKS